MVSWDSEETIDASLGRLRVAQGVAEIRVVDCNSQDSTMAIVQRHAVADPRVRFIANPDNPGLAAARNQGVAASGAPWIALLHPGCFVELDTLARLRDVAADGSAIVGADLMDEDATHAPAARLRKAAAGGGFGWRGWCGYAPEARADDAVQQVDAPSGALVLMSRRVFESLGGCSERYATGVADLDLCRRARAAGIGSVCANRVQVTRVHVGIARAHPLHQAWHQRRDAARFVRSDAATSGTILAQARIWSGLPLALLRALASGV